MLRVFIRTMCSTTTSTTIKHAPPIPVFGVVGRYVSALYSAASQKEQLAEVEKHLTELNKELTKPAIKEFINTSLMNKLLKAQLLTDVAKEAGMPDTAINFLGVVAENNRLNMLRRMINMFKTVMVAHRNEALCEVITAKPLDDSSRDALMSALKKFIKGNKKIKLTEKVDRSIIGGMVVGIEDKHIDLSIAKKIRLYTEILKQSV